MLGLSGNDAAYDEINMSDFMLNNTGPGVTSLGSLGGSVTMNNGPAGTLLGLFRLITFAQFVERKIIWHNYHHGD